MASLQERALLVSEAAKDVVKQSAHMELCARDPRYWFDNFCVTFDPRVEPSVIPFNLYDVQAWFLTVLIEKITAQQDFGVEKSRDVGATWLIALFFLYCWLFKPGWNFHIGSMKEDKVDKKGDISTTFEKIRFCLSYLPKWMKPKGFQEDKHSLHMRLVNPENGNVITGESANAGFARSGRYRAVFFDEFPEWLNDFAAWTSASQSTKCRVALGTPKGKHNKHGQLMTAKSNRRIIWPGRNAMEEQKGLHGHNPDQLA